MNKALRVVLGIHTLGISELVRASKEASEKRRIEREEKEELERRRKNSPFTYNECIDAELFEKIVSGVLNSIKRIEDYSISGAIIEATVRTQSGIGDWDFSIDYNDFGKLTGNYWILEYGNGDSDIPNSVAERIKKEVIKVSKINDYN